MSELTITMQASGKSTSRWGKYLVVVLLGVTPLAWIAAVVIDQLGDRQSMRTYLPSAWVMLGLLAALQLAVLLTLPGIRAMVKHTFAQCLRMKIAGVFIVLLALALLLVSTQMKGDGTLTGQARTFLAYSTTFVTALLSVVTVFLSAGAISNDIQKKTIFTVATKPLARWQYVLGRWLGVVLLGTTLLAGASAVIWGVSRYIHGQTRINAQPIEPTDRLALETEVFTARRRVSPKSYEVDAQVKLRMEQLKADQGRFRSTLEEYMVLNGGQHDAALAAIEAQIRRQVLASEQSAAALPSNVDANNIAAISQLGGDHRLAWQFQGIQTAGTQVYGDGTVTGDILQDASGSIVLLEIRAAPAILGQLMYQGPVRVENLDGRVEQVLEQSFRARILNNEAAKARLASLADGSPVRLEVEPILQVTYKAEGDGEVLKGVWVARNPSNGVYSTQWRDDPMKSQATLTIPSRVVSDDGRMDLYFINRSSGSVTILQSDVGVLYKVASFEGNFVRCMIMILLQLMVLAAVGVMASTFLSFPVASLVTFAAFVASFTLNDMMPGLRGNSIADLLVRAVNVDWGTLGHAAFIELAVRAMLVLAAACLIYHKRELARVQV